MRTNITEIYFNGHEMTTILIHWQHDYKQILKFADLDLPFAYEVDFANAGDTQSKTMIGNADGVEIPDEYLMTGKAINAYIYLHDASDSGETVRKVSIQVHGRPERTEEIPEPHQQSVIDQAIAALDAAVEQTASDVQTTGEYKEEAHGYADEAKGYAERAEAAVEDVSEYATRAETAAAQAEGFATTASEKATEAGEYVTEAKGYSESASGYATEAKGYSESASSFASDAQASSEASYLSAQSSSRYASDASGYASSAYESSQNASSSASDASSAKDLAVQARDDAISAKNDAVSAKNDAISAKDDAVSAKNSAEGFASDASDSASDAQGYAESAQTSAEQAQESAEYVETALIDKADVITSTASGEIVTIADGGDNLPVKDLTVSLLPVQDLHGQDAPYPAGGGKQLFDPSTFDAFPKTMNGITATLNEDGTISLTGTATFTTYLPIIDYKYLSEYGFIEADTSYTLSGYYSSSAYCMFGVYGSGTDYADITGSGRAFSFNASQISSLRYRLLIYIANGSTLSNAVIKPMICKSSATNPTTFAPYSNYCPISGWTGVEVNQSGKNLAYVFDDGYVPSTSTGELVQYSGARTDFIKVKPNTAYVAIINPSSENAFLFQYDKDKRFIRYNAGNGFIQITTESNTEYLMLRVSEQQLASSNIQLELGSATAYEPYNGNTYPIDWTDEAGTVYGGSLDVTTGVLTVNYKYYTNSGTGAWGEITTGGSRYYIGGVSTDAVNADTTGVCNLGLLVSEYYQDGIQISNNGRINLCGSLYSAFASLDALKTYLSSNPLQVVYKLATPLTYQLSASQLSTLLGTNNFWSNGNGTLDLEYRADTKLYIEQLTKPSEDDMVANQNITADSFFMIGNRLFLSSVGIGQGQAIVPGTNCTEISLADALNQLNS